jgi:hypothetical protein
MAGFALIDASDSRRCASGSHIRSASSRIGPTSRVIAFSLGKMRTTVGATLDFTVEPLKHIRAVNLRPVLLREVHKGEHLVLGVVHHRCKFRKLRPQLLDDDMPLPGGPWDGSTISCTEPTTGGATNVVDPTFLRQTAPVSCTITDIRGHRHVYI